MTDGRDDVAEDVAREDVDDENQDDVGAISGDENQDGFGAGSDDESHGGTGAVGGDGNHDEFGAGDGDGAYDDASIDEATARGGPEPRPDAEILEYTTEKRSLSPLVRFHWGIRVTIGAFILGFIGTFVLRNLGVDSRFGVVLTLALLVLGVIWVVLYYRRWAYQIRADAIYLERGVATHVRTLVPYVRIQHVDTSRGPLERAFGLSTLVVYTAGSRGADVSIPGLRPEQARDLQQRVKELAIEAEGGDAL